MYIYFFYKKKKEFTQLRNIYRNFKKLPPVTAFIYFYFTFH